MEHTLQQPLDFQPVIKELVLALTQIEIAQGKMKKIMPLAENMVQFQELSKLHKKLRDTAADIAKIR